MLLRLIPMMIAFLLMAAHFLRSGSFVLVGVSVLLPFLLLAKKRWALFLVQGATYLGAVIWVWTTVILVQQRIMVGEQWVRMCLILSGVAAFSLYAGYLLNADTIESRYR